MHISIELFLLDNFAMNLILLHLAAAISGLRLLRIWDITIAAAGSVYALAAVAAIPILLSWPAKILMMPLMALPLRRNDQKDFLRALLSTCLAAAIMGGLLFFICSMSGGKEFYGALWGTPPVRIVLLGSLLCMTLPKIIRRLKCIHWTKDGRIPIRITQKNSVWYGKAMLDTGNTLAEPVSGLPVIVVSDYSACGREWPVPYESIGGTGMLLSVHPERIELYFSGWCEVDAMVAESPRPIMGADAIIGVNALPMKSIRAQERS